MYIFCSKALADALNIKKNELQKMLADAQIDELYAWHGHITKINGENTIILPSARIPDCISYTILISMKELRWLRRKNKQGLRNTEFVCKITIVKYGVL